MGDSNKSTKKNNIKKTQDQNKAPVRTENQENKT